MAISQLQLPSYQVNNLVDQGQWGTLANLGTVYKDAQDAANKKAVLASLGDDPEANKATLLRSGDPALATMGINLQQKDIDRQREAERNAVADAHWQKNYAIQKAAADRLAADYEEKGVDKAAIPGLVAQQFPALAQGASPFPAPPSGPSPLSTVPPIPQTQTPSYIPPPQPTMPPTAQPPAALALPSTGQPPQPLTASPMPNTAQPPPPPFMQPPPPIQQQPAVTPPQAAVEPPVTPPVKAESADTSLPEWTQSAQAAPPSLVDRASTSLVAGTSPAAAGISRETIGKMIQNPYTRDLGVALLKQQVNPGEWTYHDTEQGLMAVNSLNPNQTKIVAPKSVKPTVVGSHALIPDPANPGQYRDIAPQAPIQLDEGKRLMVPDPNSPSGFRDATPDGTVSKGQRERDDRYKDARARGLDENTANYIAINNKSPKADMSATELKMLDTHEGAVRTGMDVIDNLNEMKKLSNNAYEGAFATNRAKAAAALGKDAPQAALDTLRMQNLANQNITSQLKTLFPGRVLVAELGLQKEIETLPEHPNKLRQDIADQLIKIVQHRVNEAKEVAGAVRNKTYGTAAFTPHYGRSDAEIAEAILRQRGVIK